MPIFVPFMIAAGVASLVGYGGKKGYDGVSAMKHAKVLGDGAQAKLKRAVAANTAARAALNVRLGGFQDQKAQVHQTTLTRMVEFLDRLDQQARVAALNSLGALGVSHDEVKAFAVQYVEASGVVRGAVVAAMAGAGASSVTSGLVTGLATAGTGAAISGLSGAAAESAALAWLGGGTLASGGMGMAGGAAVLGGVAVAPVIAVGGFVLALQGEKAVTRATEYAAEAAREIAKLAASETALRRVRRRIDELSATIEELARRANQALDALWGIGPEFTPDDDVHMLALALAMTLSKALSELTRVSVLTQDDEFNTEVDGVVERHRALLHGAFQ